MAFTARRLAARTQWDNQIQNCLVLFINVIIWLWSALMHTKVDLKANTGNIKSSLGPHNIRRHSKLHNIRCEGLLPTNKTKPSKMLDWDDKRIKELVCELSASIYYRTTKKKKFNNI